MRYVDEARARARRRKSGWNILLFAVISIVMLATAIGWAIASVMLHRGLYPDQGPGFDKGIAAIMATVSGLFAAIPIAMIVGNFLVWMIPPAQRALDDEARTVKGTDFFSAQRQLLKLAATIVPVALLLAIIGASMPWYR